MQASDQRIQYFHQLQRECDIAKPLSIVLHGNMRWGTASGMTRRGFQLQKPIARFIKNADERFGPITIIRKEGKIVKKIPWTAFDLTTDDWNRIEACAEILEDANNIQQLFSTPAQATMYRVIPAVENLLTLWEEKRADPRYAIYVTALDKGIDKINKYYRKLDQKPAYILGMRMNPFFFSPS